MNELKFYADLIHERLAELGVRVAHIGTELSAPKPHDLNDQAIDIEDDEVLEGLGQAAQKEVALLKAALARIEDKTYGVCLKCGGEISGARLKAVPYAPLCKTCVQASKA